MINGGVWWVKAGSQYDAGPSVASVACPTQCKRSWNGTRVYSSVAYRTQRNTRIYSNSIPVSLVLRRKKYMLTMQGPASYCDPALRGAVCGDWW